VAVVRRSGLEVSLLRGDGTGPGRARNLGAANASAVALAFTDADCAPEPTWLRAGLEALANADLVQGAVLPDPGAPTRPFDRTVTVTSERGLYETASLFVRRTLFDDLGGFEDWLVRESPAGGRTRPQRPFGEDLLFGWRARRRGARTSFSADAVVHHEVFRRGPLGYLRERLRLRHFPAIARRIPETRERVFYRRYFLTRRSAAFDLAVASAPATLLAGSLLPLLAALPYLYLAVANAGRAGPRWAPLVLPVAVAADALALASLAWGSIRNRTALL
jgi:hypothetical protein